MLTMRGGVEEGDPDAVERSLKILDRLDRYHGFTRGARMVEPYGGEERKRLLDKINRVAARLQAAQTGE